MPLKELVDGQLPRTGLAPETRFQRHLARLPASRAGRSTPVYAIDVCKRKSLASCKADDDSAWESLEAFSAHTNE